MLYTKSTGAGGPWVDKTKVVSGTKVKLVSESVPVEEVFKGEKKTRNVVKIRIEGDPDVKNFELNKPSLNGLIDAYGGESKDWVNKPLTAITETVIVSGRRGKAMYLVPEGFEVGTDAGGFVVVQPVGAAQAAAGETSQDTEDSNDIRPEDIPF